jgi:hypothetical protein
LGKKIFSTFGALDDLAEFLGVEIEIQKESRNKFKYKLLERKTFGDENYCSSGEYKAWWASLWTRAPKHFPNVPKELGSLSHHLYASYKSCRSRAFYNGSGKTFFYTLCTFAQSLHRGSFWDLRISTTTNPQTDWCGLPEKVGGKKENQLNGMYPTHVAILVKITDLGKVTSCMHDVTSYWRLVKF